MARVWGRNSGGGKGMDQGGTNGIGSVPNFESHAGAVDDDGQGADTPFVEYEFTDGGEGQGDDTAEFVRLTKVTYPDDDRVVTYHYDGADGIDNVLSRLSRIADEEDTTTYAAYTYLGAGTIVQVAHPAVSGGLVLTYGSAGNYTGWDRFGRVVDQRWTNSAETTDASG